MAFFVGQKVVCVNVEKSPVKATWHRDDVRARLNLGSVYTIREIDTRAIHIHNTVAIRLEEIVFETEASSVGAWEPGFHPRRFRPIVERKTGYEILERIRIGGPLTDAPEEPKRATEEVRAAAANEKYMRLLRTYKDARA